MPTVEDVARSALADVSEPAVGLLNVGRWVIERYHELAAGIRLRQLRRVGELVVPAAITAGTINVTQGSHQVTPNATAIAAWSGQGLDGRYLRVETTWYHIASAVEETPSGALTLTSPYTDSTNAAATYQIVQRHLALPADVGYLGDFFHERLFCRLDSTSLEELNRTHPDRTYSTAGPMVVSEVGADAFGHRLIEIYPYSDQDELIRYLYWITAPPLALESTLPYSVDLSALKEGVLINLYRWNAAAAVKAGNIEAGAYWRNESRAQETRWKKHMQRIIRADKGRDDTGMVLRSRFSHGGRSIENARDEVYARGNRP